MFWPTYIELRREQILAEINEYHQKFLDSLGDVDKETLAKLRDLVSDYYAAKASLALQVEGVEKLSADAVAKCQLEMQRLNEKFAEDLTTIKNAMLNGGMEGGGGLVDKTLTLSGVSADAKVTGDMIRAVESKIGGEVEASSSASVSSEGFEHNITRKTAIHYFIARLEGNRAIRFNSINIKTTGEGNVKIVLFSMVEHSDSTCSLKMEKILGEVVSNADGEIISQTFDSGYVADEYDPIVGFLATESIIACASSTGMAISGVPMIDEDVPYGLGVGEIIECQYGEINPTYFPIVEVDVDHIKTFTISEHIKSSHERLARLDAILNINSFNEGSTLIYKDGAWKKEKLRMLPTVGGADKGKLLTVTGANSWGVIEPPSSLPEVTTTDNGKVLSVVDGVWTPSVVESGEKEMPVYDLTQMGFPSLVVGAEMSFVESDTTTFLADLANGAVIIKSAIDIGDGTPMPTFKVCYATVSDGMALITNVDDIMGEVLITMIMVNPDVIVAKVSALSQTIGNQIDTYIEEALGGDY